MITYEKNYSAKRDDGRYTCSMAAQLAMMRDIKKGLALPENMTAEDFSEWKLKVREKLTELLKMPKRTPQPAPKMLSCVKRDGYRAEKWEFYPDDYSAVPFYALIPDCASAENRVPAVMCFIGSNHTKEFVAGEPRIDHINGQTGKFPERNDMGRFYVQNGYAAFVFDNAAIGECSLLTDPEYGDIQYRTRSQMCFGDIQLGMTYTGNSIFQKLIILEHICGLDYVDTDKIAVSGHSLGTATAVGLALLSDKIKAVVFNDFLCDTARRYMAITEEPEDGMMKNTGLENLIPGIFRWFGFPELCAALAPLPLAINEGGADEFINTVRRGYKFADAADKLQISYYPMFSDESTRKEHGNVPDKGLTKDEFYIKYSYVNAPDHSFRKEPSLRLLKNMFGA